MIFFLMTIYFFYYYAGRATYSDKLFKFRNGQFEDLLSDELNVRRGVANGMAGRSVACVDRKVSEPINKISHLSMSCRFLNDSQFFPSLCCHLLLCREQAVTQSMWPTTQVATLVLTLS